MIKQSARYAIALAAFLALSVSASAATDGIAQLIAVTQQKASNASSSALGAAERQRQLIADRRSRGENVKQEEELYRVLQANSAQVKELEQQIRQLQAQIKKKGCNGG